MGTGHIPTLSLLLISIKKIEIQVERGATPGDLMMIPEQDPPNQSHTVPHKPERPQPGLGFVVGWTLGTLVGGGLGILIFAFLVLFGVSIASVSLNASMGFITLTEDEAERIAFWVNLTGFLLILSYLAIGVLIAVPQAYLLHRFHSGVTRNWMLATSLGIPLVGGLSFFGYYQGFQVVIGGVLALGRRVGLESLLQGLWRQNPELGLVLLISAVLGAFGFGVHLLQWAAIAKVYVSARRWLWLGILPSGVLLSVFGALWIFTQGGAPRTALTGAVVAATVVYPLLGGYVWRRLLSERNL